MNKPRIRFKGFEGEWKERRIGDICNVSTGKSNTQDKVDDGKFPFYVRSPHIEKSNKYLYDEEAVLTVGDGVGTGKVFHYVNGKYDLHQRVYRLYDFKGVNALCFYYYFSQKFYKRVMAMTAKSSVDSVRLDFISEMHLPFPSLPEQRAIASYFTSLDAQIAASTSRLSSLKQIKAASLLNMFPQKGETVPRVRFKGFQGEWKERKLGEIAIVNPKCDLPKSFEYVDLESVVGTEMKSHRREFRESAPSRAQRLARKGDIFYQTVRPYQKNNYLFNLDYSDYVFSSGYAQIQALKDERFLFTVVQSDYFLKQVMDNCTGTSFPSINPTLLRNLIVYDCSIDEQRAIGQYLTALDAQITLHRERLEILKQIKAACHEKMFA